MAGYFLFCWDFLVLAEGRGGKIGKDGASDNYWKIEIFTSVGFFVGVLCRCVVRWVFF